MTKDKLLKVLAELQHIAYRAVGGRGTMTELRGFFIGLLTAHAGEMAEALHEHRHEKTITEKEASQFQQQVNYLYAHFSNKYYSGNKEKAPDEQIKRVAGLHKFASRYKNQHNHSVRHYQVARAHFAMDKALYESADTWVPTD